MRLKQEAPNHIDNEEEDGDRVCCPVCTHYLRKDVSLHDHLNTHPKQQVIEALIQLKDACKSLSPPASVQAKSSSSAGSSSSLNTTVCSPASPVSVAIESEEGDEAEPEDASTSSVHPHPAESPAVASTSTGHIVQYSPFLAGPASVPSFIHVPVVTSADSNSPVKQLPIMLYSQFICPSGSTQVSLLNTSRLSPNQHLQYVASSSLIRAPFSIVQNRPNFGISQASSLLTSVPEANAEGSPVEGVVPGKQSHRTEDSNDSSNSEVQLLSPVNPLAEEDEEEKCSAKESQHLGTGNPTVPGSASSLECENEPEENPPESAVLEDQEPSSAQEREMLSPPKKRRCPDWNAVGSPGSHSTSSMEGILRVRSDLSVSPITPPPQFDDKADSCKNLAKERTPKAVRRILTSSGDGDCFTSNDSVRTAINCSSIPGVVSHTSVSEEEQTICEPTLLGCLGIRICTEDEEGEIHSDGEDLFNVATTTTAVDSCQINEFLLPHRDYEDDSPGSPPCDSGPPSPYQKSVEYLDSPATPLNIQTDETMPPRGELSEQESIGGNSSSMWSVPAYHTSRELPSPVVSYDLTARESWPGSDISDSEGNANLVPDGHPTQQFSTVPSFSNTLHSFIPKCSSDNSFVVESPFSAHLSQTSGESLSGGMNASGNSAGCNVGSGKSPSKNLQNANTPTPRVRKGPTKPRVFRCKECSSQFPTLKLRRLHPCEQLRSSNESTSVTSSSLMSVGKEVNGDVQIPGSSSRDELSSQSKPKKKYQRKPKTAIKKEIIVDDQPFGQASFREQFQVSKTEPDDGTESRLSSDMPSVIPLTVPCQESAFETAASNLSFVEVSLKPESPQPAFGHQCQKCGETFKSAKLSRAHLSSKHKDQKYQCATCGDCFEKESGYLDHLMVHPLECQMCGKTFKKRKSLSMHMKWHLDVKPHKCETCTKSFVTKQKLDEHMNTHTGNAPIKCKDCEETFKRYSNLIQHRNRHHLNLKRKTRDYFCHCGEVYQSKEKLEWHKEIHDDKPKSCQYCSEKFVHTASLTRHIRKAHDRRYVPKKEREGENIECPVCHLVYLKSSLTAHIKTHNAEHLYSCHICGRDFSTKWNLQLHRWTHASRSSKPFKCTLCKAAFFRKQDFQTHMHSHRNVRPFTCNHCGCQFIRKYNCLRHMREHEEGKNFACTICNKHFHRSYYLKDHMRVHSGSRPFSCHICGKASTCKSNHNKHVRIHHAREPQNTEI